MRIKKECKTCMHFVQHYGKRGNVYFPLYCGHCIVGKSIRSRKPDIEACAYYEHKS